MNKTIILISLLLGSFAFAKVDKELRVPVIQTTTFPVGRSFIWNYLDHQDIYSTEKYTVLVSEPTRVLFEMSTKLAGETEFKPHHRLEVNPQACLKSYAKAGFIKPWSIKLYYWNKDRWVLNAGLNKTLAFEEKFNCDAFVHSSMYRTTVSMDHPTELGIQKLFAHRKHVNLEPSWYFFDGPWAGVLAYKKMSKPYEKHQYTINFTVSN